MELGIARQLNSTAPMMVMGWWFGYNGIGGGVKDVDGGRLGTIDLDLPQANNQGITFVGHGDTVSKRKDHINTRQNCMASA